MYFLKNIYNNVPVFLSRSHVITPAHLFSKNAHLTSFNGPFKFKKREINPFI